MSSTTNNNFTILPATPVNWIAAYNDAMAKLEAGRTLYLQAGEALAKKDCFYIANDGKAWKGNGLVANRGLWQSTSTIADAYGYGQINGTMVDESWTWTKGTTLYSNSSGALTETLSGYAVGYAKSSTEVVIEPFSVAAIMCAAMPAHYERDVLWALKTPYTTAANRYTLLTPNYLTVNINNSGYMLSGQQEIDVSVAANWDTTAGTDYTVAANRAGKDFYVYLCHPTSGVAPVIKLSVNSTVPTGYISSNSRKVGGFHCLCGAVGTISGHALTGFAAGDILPASIWDLNFRAANDNNAGLVYDPGTGLWVQIYLASGTGTSTSSVYGGTISDTRNWMDFVDDGHAIGMRLLTDHEFQSIASGSNEETNISGAADPVTSGGHSDTASRRMISNIGCEDCCGAMWQWLLDQSYRFDGAANHTHTENTASTYTQNATTANPSGDMAPAWVYYDLPGSKGSLYRQGTYGDIKLLAGGNWNDAAWCGSRSRSAGRYRWHSSSSIGGRFAVEPKRRTT